MNNNIIDTQKNSNTSIYHIPVKNKLDTKNNKVTNTSPSFNLQKNFLTLLIAQIQNQDPIDPIKNTELTSQLAQINTVGQIEKLNNTVEKIKSQTLQKKKIEMSSLIGRHVMSINSQLIHNKNVPTKFGIELMNNATLTHITIKDAEGKIVFVKNIENLHPGIYHFLWSGNDLENKNVDTGQYTVSVVAKNNNEDVAANTLRESVVQSVTTNASNVSNIVIGLGANGTTTLDNIHEIFA